jgi:pre-mRNA-processing factor 19
VAELTTAAFHPDGHLFAAGGADGNIKLYHTKSAASAADFNLGSPVQALTFSENGIMFAAVAQDSTNVTIFDLRKEGEAAKTKILDIGNNVTDIDWDYTGQFLATAGPSGVTVQQYAKSSKSWSEPLRSAVPATAVKWGSRALSLVSVNTDGVVSVLGSN